MPHTYHDVEVEYGDSRFRLRDASYSLELTCTRAGGWRLWNNWQGHVLLAGEYDYPKLKVYVRGELVCG